MSSTKQTPSERIFVYLLRAFPSTFRRRFERDMCELFRDQLDAAARERGGVSALWVRTLPSFLRSAMSERTSQARSFIGSPQGIRSMFREITSDLRLALRMLRRAPLFAAVSVVIIALGIGAVTTTFSAMESLLLRAVPGTHDTEHVMGTELLAPDGDFTMQASPEFLEFWRARGRSVSAVAGHTRDELTLTIDGSGASVEGGIVTANFLDVLHVRAVAGRLFSAADDSVGSTPVTIISHSFWRDQFSGDRRIVGKVISVNGHATTIVGVAEAGFVGAMSIMPSQLWITKAAAQQLLPERRSWLRPVVALKPGVSVGAAEREISALLAQRALEPEPLPDGIKRTSIRLSPLRAIPADARGDFMGFLSVMLGAAALVLVIASVNVGTMLSARSIARQREMALRAALGAGRLRLIRQLMAESILLYALGGALGAVMAVYLTSAIEQLRVPLDINLQLEISPNPAVFAFALCAALLTGLIFGLGPALGASRADITTQLRDDSAGAGRRRSRATSVLIVGQLGASLVLLVCASLFSRALNSGRAMDTGFNATDVGTLTLRASQWGYDETRVRAFYVELRNRLRGMPNVEGLSYTARLPLTASGEGGRFFIEGREPTVNAEGRAVGEALSLARVDESYFSVLRMPLRAGRGFSEVDARTAPKVAVINETMATRFWPSGSALGHTFVFLDTVHTIVGVVRDSRYQSLNDPVPPVVYVPITQHWQADQILMIRGAGDAYANGRLAASALAEMGPTLPRPPIVPLQSANGVVLIPQQIAAVATAVMGGVGLFLAAVGLYGIIAYSVGRRSREIGVRMAIGASAQSVRRMVVGEGFRLTLSGVAVGLVLSLGAGRLVATFLLNVSPFDPLTFLVVPIVFMVIATVASYLPARRAAALDPLVALRAE